MSGTLASGLFALAGCVESVRDYIHAAAAAQARAQQLRDAGDEAQAEAVVAAVFADFAPDERRCFEDAISELERENAAVKTKLAVAAQNLTAEREARAAAEAALADANAKFATAESRARLLLAQAAGFKADVERLTGAAGPLPPGLLPPISLPPGPLLPGFLPEAPSPAPAGSIAKAPPIAAPSTRAARCDAPSSGGEASRFEEKRSGWDEGSAKRTRRGSAASSGAEWLTRGARTTGADMPPVDTPDDEQEPRYWDAWHAGKWHVAGYKVHVRDLPSDWTAYQLTQWLANRQCPQPLDRSVVLRPSPRGRAQIVLTFGSPDEAGVAKAVLDGCDLEHDKHRSQTKWFQSSDA